MIDKIKELIEEVKVFSAHSLDDIEIFRIQYLGKKGLLNKYFAEFKNIPNIVGLKRSGASKEVTSEIKLAYKLLCRSNLNTKQAVEALEKENLKRASVK